MWPRAICGGRLLVNRGGWGYKVLCHQLAILTLLHYDCGREITTMAASDSEMTPSTTPVLGFAASLF